MITIFFRTIIIYFVLVFSLRLMGKRQIGELQVSEFIVAIMLSEIAVTPITSRSAPLMHAIISILLLLSIEVIISFVLLKSNKLKRLFCGSPTVLVRYGKINTKGLCDNRIELDELLSELRQKGFDDVSKVAYAILEENGKMSVFPRTAEAPVTLSDLNLTPTERGIAHVCVLDGTIITDGLHLASWDSKRLSCELKKRDTDISDVFLLTVDDSGKVNLILKDKIK